MTNEELQKHNAENLKVWCRGPRKIHEDRVLAINAKRIQFLTEHNAEGLENLAKEFSGLMGNPWVLSDDWNLEIVKLMDIRVGCGEDISSPIGAPPYDQQTRKYTCPKCGTVHTVTPALSDEEAEAQASAFQDSLSKLVD